MLDILKPDVDVKRKTVFEYMVRETMPIRTFLSQRMLGIFNGVGNYPRPGRLAVVGRR